MSQQRYNMKFESLSEELFFDFLNDFELTSMIRKIESQVWIKTPYSNRRIDFVLTLTNGEKIFIEVDGPHHKTPEGIAYDAKKDHDLSYMCVNIFRIDLQDFFFNKQTYANKIEGLIEQLNGA